jgi:hypothetical protein
MVKGLFLFIVVVLLIPRNAHAYIDLSAGSMMLQIFLGSIIGVIIWLRTSLVNFIKNIFKR